MHNKNYKKWLILLFILAPTLTLASGFELFGENGSELGNAYAGASAAAFDASTNYFNPAGLILFDTRQVTYATLLRFSDVDFDGASQWQYLPSSMPGSNYSLNGSVDSKQTNIIPSFNEAIPLNQKFALGLSVVMPFDFSTDYAEDSVLQYAATDSSLYIVDITPSIAYQIDPKWSVGVGFDAEHAEFAADYMQGMPASMFNLPSPNALNSETKNSANGWGFSGHGGVMYQYSPTTRFGLSYHAPVSFNLSGESKLFGPITQAAGSSGLITDDFSTNFKMPDFAEFSAYHKLGASWELLGSLDYIHWSLLNMDTFNNVQTVNANGAAATTTLVLPIKLHDAFRVAAGVNYLFNDKWKLLTGIAYDEGAASNNNAINFPDNNSLALATGVHYQLNRSFAFDVGYSHLFSLGKQSVNATSYSGMQQVNVLGNVARGENIVGAQITWNIGYLGVTHST